MGKHCQKWKKTHVNDQKLALITASDQIGIRIPELVKTTGAGDNTVRRTVAYLYSQGLIKRTSNGKAMSKIPARQGVPVSGPTLPVPANAAIPLYKAFTTVQSLEPLNRDDEIFRTDGVYFRDTDPPFSAGSETVLGNVFMDFNVKVISL